jgi:uncharacterized protein (TIGR00369 family)
MDSGFALRAPRNDVAMGSRNRLQRGATSNVSNALSSLASNFVGVAIAVERGSNAHRAPAESDRMTDTDANPAHIPAGFTRHTRSSPLTAPWEPLYAMTTADAVMIGLRIREAHTNSRGLAHGGLITALADNAMGLSCGVRLGGAARLLTSSLAIDFLGPARIGQWLQIEPDVIKLGATLCVAQCLVTADGVPCARANGSFSVVKPKG